jgi:hypothetical protein
MRTAIACGVLVVLAGCGSNGPEVSTTQDNVCEEIAQVACFDMYQCCSEGEIESVLGVNDPRTETDCESDLRTRCERQVADFDFSIKNKHVRFDAKAMNACLKEFVAPSGTCVTVEAAKPWAEACMTSAWVGIVDVGGTCDFPYECTADSFCAANRTCTALATANMPCSSATCASGLFCDFAAAGGAVCHPLLGAGAACTGLGQCQKELFCDTAAPIGSRTCTAPHANGETCDNASGSCKSTLCLRGTCSTSGFSCFNDTSCGGRCSNNTALACNTDGNCGSGTCTGTGTTCFVPTDCVAPNTCTFPNKCNLDKCMGNVCADPHLTIDYCVNALVDLPLLDFGQVVGNGG